ncbi:hypothetical protein JTE90_013007 [Oedothorax gibbosus]|uniref:Dehydrogenase/reductase SDR family member 7 n=1 Tax=Oedothorax gibbosus TaxID=931172 RepID=A0AAV6UM27_9ARAC|nr:hypothetical protein JTE90_013007 [Oedothorax gibbosus]
MLFADADLTLLFYHLLPEKNFQNKVVWITGASSGIGEYLAYSFAKRRAILALSGVNVERLENVKKHCIEIAKCAEENILLVPFEIQNFEIHEACVKKVLDHFGHIDILVNNAGVSQRADFKDIDIEVDLHLFNINVFGMVNLTRKVLGHFLERKKGHVVVTSSTAGKLGAPYSSAYTGSKHALHGYFECLRSEMVEENISVTLVCPGPVFSQITDRCVTAKLGEKYGHTQQTTDKKMATERCSELMVTAIGYKLDECWICIQPLLFIYYLAQYMPSIFRNVLIKLFFNKKTVMKMRQGR